MFGGFFLRANARWRVLKIFGPSLAKPKIKAAKEKCAGDTQYRRAHFNTGCVDFGESDDVENIFNTLLLRAGHFEHKKDRMLFQASGLFKSG